MLRIANGFTTVSDRQRNHLTETAETINETTAKPRVKLPVKPRNRLLRRRGRQFRPSLGAPSTERATAALRLRYAGRAPDRANATRSAPIPCNKPSVPLLRYQVDRLQRPSTVSMPESHAASDESAVTQMRNQSVGGYRKTRFANTRDANHRRTFRRASPRVSATRPQ